MKSQNPPLDSFSSTTSLGVGGFSSSTIIHFCRKKNQVTNQCFLKQVPSNSCKYPRKFWASKLPWRRQPPSSEITLSWTGYLETDWNLSKKYWHSWTWFPERQTTTQINNWCFLYWAAWNWLKSLRKRMNLSPTLSFFWLIYMKPIQKLPTKLVYFDMGVANFPKLLETHLREENKMFSKLRQKEIKNHRS